MIPSFDSYTKTNIPWLRIIHVQWYQDDEIKLDIRVIAATHRNLEQEVKAGNFREDLYYRLNVVPINMPPLRERQQDIALLADHFIQTHVKQL